MEAPKAVAERWLIGVKIRHVRAVAEQGRRLFPLDDALFSACWLHDIGYAASMAASGMHALDGAAWCHGQGYDEEVVGLIAWHTGARFEAEERNLLSRLEAYKLPSEDRLDALTLCDLTSSPSGAEVDVRDRIDEILRRYPEEDVVHRAVSRSQDELVASSRRAIGRLGLAEGWGLTAL